MKKGVYWLYAMVVIALVLIFLMFYIANLKMFDTSWTNECEGAIQAPAVTVSGTKYYLSGVCTTYTKTGKADCESAFTEVFENDATFCIWIDATFTDPLTTKEVNGGCVVNHRVNCEDLTEATNPNCGQVPGCRLVNKLHKRLSWLR